MEVKGFGGGDRCGGIVTKNSDYSCGCSDCGSVLQLVETLRPLVPRILRHDRSLADHLVRAASSVALNIAEGEHSDPENRKARFYSAAGSANETLAALRVAACSGS